jgi:hypothetical protein
LRIDVDAKLIVAFAKGQYLVTSAVEQGFAAVPQSLVIQGSQDESCRVAVLLAQARCQTPGMQAGLLGAVSVFLQHSGGAVDNFNKAASLLARQALPLPHKPQSRSGEIARQGVAKRGDLSARTEWLRRRRRIELFAFAFNHLSL